MNLYAVRFMLNFHPKKSLNFSQIFHLEAGCQSALEACQFVIIFCHYQKIIHVEDNKRSLSVRSELDPNSIIRLAFSITEFDELTGNGLKPNIRSLFKPIERLQKEKDVILFTRNDVSLWLFDVYPFFESSV